MVDISSSTTGQVPVLRRVESEQVSQVRSFLTKEPEPLPEGEKPRRRRPRMPRPISGPDEAALSWYFGQGLSIYEKSTFGPIVQKIAMDGYASTTCGKCDGAGIIEEGGGVTLDDKCRGCDGSGREPHKAGREQRWCLTCDGLGRETPYKVELPKGGWCPSCRGTGSGCVERAALRLPRCRWCRPEPFEPATQLTDEQVVDIRASKARSRELAEAFGVSRQQIWNIQKGHQRATPYPSAPLHAAWVPRHCCPNCLGTGDEPSTAEPLNNSEETGGVIGNDAALTRFAITSRRAGAVKEISPALHAALEAFYGDMGARWALTPFGRLFALSHLTPAGKKLARMGVDKPERKGKAKKKTAKNLEQLLAATIEAGASGWRGKADRLAKELADQRAAERIALPPPHDDCELAAVELNIQERIGVQANLQKSQAKDERRALLTKAAEQAAELYARAARAWNSVTTTKNETAAAARLLANLTRLGHGSLANKLKAAVKCSPKELAQAKDSMREVGYLEDEIAEAFRSALKVNEGGAQ